MSESEIPESAWFFWEEPDVFSPDGLGEMPDVEETVFAVEIEHGRRLAAVEVDWDRWSAIEPTPSSTADGSNEKSVAVDDYITAMASLLQAAAYAGMDPFIVCRDAVRSQQTRRAQALDDARRRHAHRRAR